LTPLGLRLAPKVDSMCNSAASALVSMYTYSQVVKAPMPPLDPGALSRVSSVPTLMVIGLNDQVVDPLAQHQAYRLLCAAGQPVTWLELVGDHGMVNSTAFQDTVVFRPWFTSAAAGGRPSGSCAPVVPLVSRLFTYQTSYVMNALGLTAPAGSTSSMTAAGNCSVRNGRLEPRSGGTCAITFVSKKGTRVLARTTVEVRVLSI